MKKRTHISPDDIRSSLLQRAAQYRDETGVSFSRMSTEALGDNKFLANVQAGKNFTVGTYQRMSNWLDARLSTDETATVVN